MHKITFAPKGLCIEARADETILEASTRQGLNMPKACINGVCHICEGFLIRGQVEGPQGVTDEPGAQVLCCMAMADSDVELNMPSITGPGELPQVEVAFQISSVKLLRDNVYEINLLAPAGKLTRFFAGQYLELLIPGQSYAYFTIASAPGKREMQLQLGISADNSSSQDILHYLQNNSVVRAKFPMGDVWLDKTPAVPLILVAAGTGFAQAKAMIEALPDADIRLYWINRSMEGFYSDLPNEWAQSGRIRYRGIVSHDEKPAEEELVENLIAADVGDVSRMLVIACGGRGFVYSVLDGLVAKGMPENLMRSDVFAYAPR